MAWLLCGGCDSGPGAHPRSVLIVVVDSLHAAHVSAYGYARPTTPQFDRFAARGARFENAHSQSSWTLPSTASLFTALDQESHGVRTFDDRLDPKASTLAMRFGLAGYRTAAIVQTPVLSSRHELNRGFQQYRVLDHTQESLEKALELAREEWTRRADQPLFLYVHLAPPHMPYQPPAPFAGRFGEGGASSVRGTIADCRRIHRAGLAPDSPDVLALIDRYDDSVAYSDDCVGRLLASLESTPARSDALVVWTSDHGEAFMQHGAQGHNATVYEEMLRVPLAIVALDHSIAPRVVSATTTTMDVAPTLLEECGLPPLPGPLSGRSLSSSLHADGAAGERSFFYSARYKSDEAQLQFALRRGSRKLVWSGATNESQLFDLATDPGETRDLAASDPTLAREMERELLEWAQAAAPSTPVAAPAPRAGDEKSRLNELGYADDGAEGR